MSRDDWHWRSALGRFMFDLRRSRLLQREHPALTPARAATWLGLGFLAYVALAIAFYAPVFTVAAPSDFENVSAAFQARFWTAVALHQALALGGWLLLARRVHLPNWLAVMISVLGVGILGVGTLAAFRMIFALSSLE